MAASEGRGMEAGCKPISAAANMLSANSKQDSSHCHTFSVSNAGPTAYL